MAGSVVPAAFAEVGEDSADQAVSSEVADSALTQDSVIQEPAVVVEATPETESAVPADDAAQDGAGVDGVVLEDEATSDELGAAVDELVPVAEVAEAAEPVLASTIIPQDVDPTDLYYCNYDENHPGVGSVADWLARGESEGRNVDCIDVGAIQQSCGSVYLPIEDYVTGATANPQLDYRIEYAYTVGGETHTGTMGETPLTFPENYNGGSVDVQLYIGGPEQDYVDFADEPEWAYPGQTVTVNTACNIDYCNVSEYGPPVSSIGNWLKTAPEAPNCIVVGEQSTPSCNSLDIEFTNLVKHDWVGDFQLAWAEGTSIPTDDSLWNYTWPIVNTTAAPLEVIVFIVGPESEMLLHDDGSAIFVDEDTVRYAYWYGGPGEGGVVHEVPVCNYCDPSQRPAGVGTAAWLASAPEDAVTDCIDVLDDGIVNSCGFVKIPIENRVIGFDYQIEYVEDGVTKVLPEEGAYFEPGTSVTFYIGGPERDYVDFANEGSWQYPGREITIDVADCPSITKTVSPGFTRTYDWDIEKSVDLDSVTFDDEGNGTADYTVTVTPGSFDDSGYELSGYIRVTNPGDEDVYVTVADAFEGVDCSIEGATEDVHIMGGGFWEWEYTCALPADFAPGDDDVNVATVTWGDGKSADVSVDVDWNPITNPNVEFESMYNVVNVTDYFMDEEGERVNKDWEIHWRADGEPFVFEYSRDLHVEPGTCSDITNRVVIDETDDEATAEFEACVSKDLTVVKDVTAVYDVSYPWTITKGVDKATVSIGANEDDPEVSYTVVVTAGEPTYSYELGGTITVTNNNAWAEDVVVTDSMPDAACTVSDGAATIPAGGTVTFEYTCVYEGAGVPEDGTNTATVAWGDGKTESFTADVVWKLGSESHKSVDVVDIWQDVSTLVATVAWGEDGLVVTGDDDGAVESVDVDGNVVTLVYTMTLEVDGTATCTPFTNIAQVVGDEGAVLDKDEATTEVCVGKPTVPDKPKPPVKPEPPVKPAPKPGLPATGADSMPLALSGLGMLLLGGGMLIARKRMAS